MKQSGKLRLPARVARIIDGDTLSINFNLEIEIRLLNCWAEELRDKDEVKRKIALEAKRRLYSLLFIEESKTEWPVGKYVEVEVPFFENIGHMFTFGRLLGHVYLEGINIGEVLIQEGLAKRNK